MVKVDYPFVHETKPGNFKVRRKGFPRIRYHYLDESGQPVYPKVKGSAEWVRAYEFTWALLMSGASAAAVAPDAFAAGSWGWLIEDYLGSTDWTELKPKTKESYRPHIDRVKEAWGALSVRGTPHIAVAKMRDEKKAAPRAADIRRAVLSLLYARALDKGQADINLAANLKRLRKSKHVKPYMPWDEEVFVSFVEMMPHRIADVLMYLRFTGQRLNDVLTMAPEDVKENRVHVVQEKTGKKVWVPLHGSLIEYRERRKVVGFQTICVTTNGTGWTVDGFETVFGRIRESFGFGDVDERVHLHGLRKNAVISLLEVGCSVDEVMAITGQSEKMVRHYAKEIDRQKLADSGMKKWNENA